MTRVYRAGLLALGCFLALPAQESQVRLERSRQLDVSAADAWKRLQGLIAASPAIVNTFDPGAHLAAISLPLSTEDVRNLALDSKEIGHQPQTAHIGIWLAGTGNTATVYLRATPGSAGFFAHSNGSLEKQILDSIQANKPWRSAATADRARDFAHAPDAVWDAIATVLAQSPRVVVNEARREAGLFTISLTIASGSLKDYSSGAAKSYYYPGMATLTLWIDRTAGGSRLRTKLLLVEVGSLSPAPLPSTGRLEDLVFSAVDKKLRNENASVDMASDYKGKPAFWTVLFGGRLPSLEDFEKQGSKQELPATLDRVWAAAAKVLVQSNVIIKSDREKGIVHFLGTHTTEAAAKYSMHPMALRVSASQFGTMLQVVSVDSIDTEKEAEGERRMLSERIGTELFLKDRLKWLTHKEGNGR